MENKKDSILTTQLMLKKKITKSMQQRKFICMIMKFVKRVTKILLNICWVMKLQVRRDNF